MLMSMILCLDSDFNFVNRLVKIHALISLVDSSGDWWQTHLVDLVFRTGHLYDWRCLNGSNISLLSYPLSRPLSAAVIGYQSFVVETIVVAIKEARWKEVSILTSVHLSRPLSLCLPCSISHLSLRLNNEQSHLFSESRVFRTCYQLDSRNHMAASNTHDENTRCKCFIPVQALTRVFPSPTLDSRLGVWDSCVSVWYCQPCRNQSITNLDFLALRQLWSCEMK